MNFIRFLSASSTILMVGTLSLFAGEKTTSDSAQEKSHVSMKVSAKPDKQILLFMNPNGHPCQMQLSILDGMKEKLNGLATIKYIKTTEPGDQETFYKYGIRGLPSLIILDKNDKEIKRFTPGIQDEKTILSALKGSDK
jgi:thiol-disulfide isomerase/thioredoxin